MKIACTVCIAIVSVALFALFMVGCSKMKEMEKVGERARKTNDLKQIGLLYQSYGDRNGGKAPANADDLMQVASAEGDPDAEKTVQAVKSGKYVVIWGAAIPRDAAKASSTLLGYERDAPTAGGMVLMGDGSVMEKTAKWIQSALKANGK